MFDTDTRGLGLIACARPGACWQAISASLCMMNPMVSPLPDRERAAIHIDRDAGQFDARTRTVVDGDARLRDLDERAADRRDENAAAGRVADREAVAARRLQRDATDAGRNIARQRRRLALRVVRA